MAQPPERRPVLYSRTSALIRSATTCLIASSSAWVILLLPDSFRRIVEGFQSSSSARRVWPPVPRSSFSESQMRRRAAGVMRTWLSDVSCRSCGLHLVEVEQGASIRRRLGLRFAVHLYRVGQGTV